MIIHIEIDDLSEEAEALLSKIDIRTLIRDAFGEFASNRSPSSEYVAKRYADADPKFRERKIREVESRTELATALCQANVTVEDSAKR